MRATGSTPRPPKVPLGQPLPGRQGQPLPPFASSGRGPTRRLLHCRHSLTAARRRDSRTCRMIRAPAVRNDAAASCGSSTAYRRDFARPGASAAAAGNALPRTFGAPLPPQIARPISAPPPVYRPLPPLYRPAPAPSAVHAAPAPMQAPRPAPACLRTSVVRRRCCAADCRPIVAASAGPTPSSRAPPAFTLRGPARAAPAAPPVRVAPPPVARAPAAPAQMRAAPPPVAHAPMAPGRKG